MNRLFLFAILFFLSCPSIASEVPQILITGKSYIFPLQNTVSFELIKKNGKDFILITPNGSQGCEFTVTKITAPQQLRGKKGIILASRINSCNFKSKNKAITDFWKDVVMFDVYYVLTKKNEVKGTVRITSTNKAYRFSF